MVLRLLVPRTVLLLVVALLLVPAASSVNDYWWVESSLARVMPQTTPPAGQPEHQAATVHLAGNEHESFQVALRPAANTSYSVSWAPLRSGLKLSWEQVGLVYVFQMMANTDGPAGWWPDPTISVPQAFGVAGITTALWFTLFAPPDTPAGKYTTTITLTPERNGRFLHPPIILELAVTVFGFSLPAAPALKTAFNLQESSLASVYYPHVPKRKLWNASICPSRHSATVIRARYNSL